MKNEIKHQHGSTLTVDVSTAKYPTARLTISEKDWETLLEASNGAKWSAIPAGGKGEYQAALVVGSYRNGKRILAHRVLYPDCQAVLFRDRDKLNLLRNNIKTGRLSASRAGNAHSDSATGYKGVSPAGNAFRLDIRYAGKSHYLGLFPSPEEAHEVREQLLSFLETASQEEAIELLKEIKKDNSRRRGRGKR